MSDNVKICYLCDGKRCEICCEPCEHTTDIRHAKNFHQFPGCNAWNEIELKATWIGNYTPYTCSNPECGKTSDSKTPFCRYCGARMVD